MTNPDLAALSEAATQGPWEIDTLKSEGSYGAGDDTTEGFEVSAIYDAKGRALLDALNSDLIEVQEDYADEDGYSLAHDLTSAANAAFIVALVNAYRSGDIVLIDREGMPDHTEDMRAMVARAEAAEARESERAAVVAWLKAHPDAPVGDYARGFAYAIEAGEHLT